eukprot:Hpha_TRINITY_DN3489_c0_g1::TRINITY_DN3489_c0_g1_i1::g.32698::m.32698
MGWMSGSVSFDVGNMSMEQSMAVAAGSQLPPGWVLPREPELVQPFRDSATHRLAQVLRPLCLLWLQKRRRKRAMLTSGSSGDWVKATVGALRQVRALQMWPEQAVYKLAEQSHHHFFLDGEWILCPGELGSGGLIVLITGHAEHLIAPLREATGIAKGVTAVFSKDQESQKVAGPIAMGGSAVFGEQYSEAAHAVGSCIVRMIPSDVVREVSSSLTPPQREAAEQAHAGLLRKEIGRLTHKELAAVPAFAQVQPEVVMALSAMLRPTLVTPGQVLQLEGTPVQTIGVVVAGRVQVSVDDLVERSPQEVQKGGASRPRDASKFVLGDCAAPLPVSLPDAACGQVHGYTLRAVTYCEVWLASWADSSVHLRASSSIISQNTRAFQAVMVQTAMRDRTVLSEPAVECLVESLRSIPLIQEAINTHGVVDEWVRHALRTATFHGFLRGDTLIRGGEMTDRCWVAVRGSLIASADRRGGERQGLVCGEWHGMTCLVAHRWQKGVVAAAPTVIMALSRQAIVESVLAMTNGPGVLANIVSAGMEVLMAHPDAELPPSMNNRRSPPLWPTREDSDAPNSYAVHNSVPGQWREISKAAPKPKPKPVQKKRNSGELDRVASLAALHSFGSLRKVKSRRVMHRAASNLLGREHTAVSIGGYSESSSEEDLGPERRSLLPSFRRAGSKGCSFRHVMSTDGKLRLVGVAKSVVKSLGRKNKSAIKFVANKEVSDQASVQDAISESSAAVSAGAATTHRPLGRKAVSIQSVPRIRCSAGESASAGARLESEE